MEQVVKDFLEASSFMSAVDATIHGQIEQIRALDMPDTERAMLDWFQKHKNELMQQAGEAIAAVYTELELRRLTEFYKSDLGRLMVSKGPQVGAMLAVLQFEWVKKAHEEAEVQLFEEQLKPQQH